jgi:dephospho-CoA kinase
MKVIGVVGLPASGKGEFSRIAGEMGIPVVVMGDTIRKVLADEGIAPTDENLGKMAGSLREEMGRDAIARLTLSDIEACNAPVVLVDGIRSDAEVTTYREHFKDFILIGVSSSFEVRFQRMKDRGRSDDLLSPELLRIRDERELGWGLGEALGMADHTISNQSSLKEFQETVKHFLLSLGA